MGDMQLCQCLIFLDDILLYSKTVADHLGRLRKVFVRLEKAGLKLNPKKCRLFRKSVPFLGHVVSRKGNEVNSDKTSGLKKWSDP